MSVLMPWLERISDFSFLYPLTMAWVWMIGATVFHCSRERWMNLPTSGLAAAQERASLLGIQLPKVSVLLPCFNEQEQIEEVVQALMDLNYPDFEVIAINDGSTDQTAALLDKLAILNSRLTVIHQRKNQGKARAMNVACALASGEIVLGIDGDALLDREAVGWLVHQFLGDTKLAAVTGNPRVRTRSSLLGRIQVMEFSSIVGLIKRAQLAWFGQLFTVSGVVSAFSRQRVIEAGGWSEDMLTEDIDISWKLQVRGGNLRFEPRALVWTLMPETLHGLWRQRLRWAMGGVQVICKYLPVILMWRRRHLWPLYFEYGLSIAWAYCMLLTLTATLAVYIGVQMEWLAPQWQLRFPIFGWSGLIMAATCLVQFCMSIAYDRRYDQQLSKHFAVAIWYPLAYWIIVLATAIVAVPKTILRPSGQRAVWVSPDRGIR